MAAKQVLFDIIGHNQEPNGDQAVIASLQNFETNKCVTLASQQSLSWVNKIKCNSDIDL